MSISLSLLPKTSHDLFLVIVTVTVIRGIRSASVRIIPNVANQLCVRPSVTPTIRFHQQFTMRRTTEISLHPICRRTTPLWYCSSYRMIKVHTVGGNVYEGRLFAVDPVTKAIVLRDEESFRMISHSQISSIEGDISATPVPDVTEFGMRVNSIEKKEHIALDNAEKSISALNFDVSPNIQTLYDRLCFLWQANSMIVLDTLRIDPPYDRVICFATSGGDAGMETVIKVLDGERKKLKL